MARRGRESTPVIWASRGARGARDRAGLQGPLWWEYWALTLQPRGQRVGFEDQDRGFIPVGANSVHTTPFPLATNSQSARPRGEGGVGASGPSPPGDTHHDVVLELFPQASAHGGYVNEDTHAGPLDEAKCLKPRGEQGHQHECTLPPGPPRHDAPGPHRRAAGGPAPPRTGEPRPRPALWPCRPAPSGGRLFSCVLFPPDLPSTLGDPRPSRTLGDGRGAPPSEIRRGAWSLRGAWSPRLSRFPVASFVSGPPHDGGR